MAVVEPKDIYLNDTLAFYYNGFAVYRKIFASTWINLTSGVASTMITSGLPANSKILLAYPTFIRKSTGSYHSDMHFHWAINNGSFSVMQDLDNSGEYRVLVDVYYLH